MDDKLQFAYCNGRYFKLAIGHNVFFYRCSWRGQECNLTHMFKPVWTDVGLCYTFNGDYQQMYSTETGNMYPQPYPPLKKLLRKFYRQHSL